MLDELAARVEGKAGKDGAGPEEEAGPEEGESASGTANNTARSEAKEGAEGKCWSVTVGSWLCVGL